MMEGMVVDIVRVKKDEEYAETTEGRDEESTLKEPWNYLPT